MTTKSTKSIHIGSALLGRGIRHSPGPDNLLRGVRQADHGGFRSPRPVPQKPHVPPFLLRHQVPTPAVSEPNGVSGHHPRRRHADEVRDKSGRRVQTGTIADEVLQGRTAQVAFEEAAIAFPDAGRGQPNFAGK